MGEPDHRTKQNILVMQEIVEDITSDYKSAQQLLEDILSDTLMNHESQNINQLFPLLKKALSKQQIKYFVYAPSKNIREDSDLPQIKKIFKYYFT